MRAAMFAASLATCTHATTAVTHPRPSFLSFGISLSSHPSTPLPTVSTPPHFALSPSLFSRPKHARRPKRTKARTNAGIPRRCRARTERHRTSQQHACTFFSGSLEALPTRVLELCPVEMRVSMTVSLCVCVRVSTWLFSLGCGSRVEVHTLHTHRHTASRRRKGTPTKKRRTRPCRWAPL